MMKLWRKWKMISYLYVMKRIRSFLIRGNSWRILRIGFCRRMRSLMNWVNWNPIWRRAERNTKRIWISSRRKGLQPSTSLERKCWWIFEMWRFKCWPWTKINSKARPNWQSNKTSSFQANWNTNRSTSSNLHSKMKKCMIKWKNWNKNWSNTLK